MISATILADSAHGDHRITTFLLRYPRFIHEELLTHRVFSRNSASSRAIPSKKLIESVRNEPAMPVWWGKNQAGMQAAEELEAEQLEAVVSGWRHSARVVAQIAEGLAALGLHKQLANRFLHPVQPYTALVTATEWDDFWLQRPHAEAQPEFRELAFCMLEAYLDSEPKALSVGEWHMPFGDKMEGVFAPSDRLKIATARAARLSYLTFDGQFSVEEDVRLHDQLAQRRHWSPFEHTATPVNEYVHNSSDQRNFRGWVPYRAWVEPKRNARLTRAELQAILSTRNAVSVA